MGCGAGNLWCISEPHCSHRFIRSLLYLWSNIPNGIIQTINDTMNSIEDHNLIARTLSERMLPLYHGRFDSCLVHANKLCTDRELIK